MFWRNTIVPEVRFLEEQLNRMLLPRLGYPQLSVEFDLSTIEALQEDENNRVQRESALLDRGVLTINGGCAGSATWRRCRGATGRRAIDSPNPLRYSSGAPGGAHGHPTGTG